MEVFPDRYGTAAIVNAEVLDVVNQFGDAFMA
jgi:hypothetical protein